MTGTTAFVMVLLGVCLVGLVPVIAKARLEIARINARGSQEAKRR